MPDTIAEVRKRRLTAAKRSLNLVIEAAAMHRKILEDGGIPESDFAVHAVKYAQAVGELRLLDMVAAGGEPGDNGTAVVNREDLKQFVSVAIAAWGEPAQESPLGQLATAAFGPDIPPEDLP